MVFIPPAPQESPPPSVCDYQVKVDYGTYRCMTAQQYQQYKVDRQAQATKEGNDALPFVIPILVILLGAMFTSVCYKLYKTIVKDKY